MLQPKKKNEKKLNYICTYEFQINEFWLFNKYEKNENEKYPNEL